MQTEMAAPKDGSSLPCDNGTHDVLQHDDGTHYPGSPADTILYIDAQEQIWSSLSESHSLKVFEHQPPRPWFDETYHSTPSSKTVSPQLRDLNSITDSGLVSQPPRNSNRGQNEGSVPKRVLQDVSKPSSWFRGRPGSALTRIKPTPMSNFVRKASPTGFVPHRLPTNSRQLTSPPALTKKSSTKPILKDGTHSVENVPKIVSKSPHRRFCPVQSCTMDYQTKGHFVRHFVSRHERYWLLCGPMTAGSGPTHLWKLLKIQPCTRCDGRGGPEKVASHIWEHLPMIENDELRPKCPAPTLPKPLKASSTSKSFVNIDSSPFSSLQTTKTKTCNEPPAITHWVDATRDATGDATEDVTIGATKDSPSVPSEPPSIWSPSTTLSSLSVACSGIRDQRTTTSSSALLFELMGILQEKEEEDNMYDAISVSCDSPQDPESSVVNGLGSGESSQSNSMPGISGTRVGYKRSHQSNESTSDGEDDGESPGKRPRRERSGDTDTQSSRGRHKRIPCTQPNCLGTDEEISWLLRSLIQHHGIVICPTCCNRLTVKDGEKPEEVWRRHKTEPCEWRCISQTCPNVGDVKTIPHHRATNCLSWRALSDEDKWAFIYTCANPGQDAPPLEISEGPGLRHSCERIPRQTKKQIRSSEIVEALAKSIESKDRRIIELESALKTANDQLAQIQQHQDDQLSRQEYLLWTLMERLADNNITIPGSIRAQLSSHCPGLISKPEVVSMLSRNLALPPTPLPTPFAHQQQGANATTYTNQDFLYGLDNESFLGGSSE